LIDECNKVLFVSRVLVLLLLAQQERWSEFVDSFLQELSLHSSKLGKAEDQLVDLGVV